LSLEPFVKALPHFREATTIWIVRRHAVAYEVVYTA
jgi:hypothetical protein